MKITVCIGSSCHVKGSHPIIECFRSLIAQHRLEDRVELAGTFCMGQCRQGVCVTVDEAFYSVSPDSAEAFFREHVLPAWEN